MLEEVDEVCFCTRDLILAYRYALLSRSLFQLHSTTKIHFSVSLFSSCEIPLSQLERAPKGYDTCVVGGYRLFCSISSDTFGESLLRHRISSWNLVRQDHARACDQRRRSPPTSAASSRTVDARHDATSPSTAGHDISSPRYPTCEVNGQNDSCEYCLSVIYFCG